MANPLRNVDWKVFWILLGGALVGVLAVLPYVADLLARGVFAEKAAEEIPLLLVVPLAIFQNGILLCGAILVGMRLSASVGLEMPLIRAWARGERPARPGALLLPGLLVGVAAGAIMVAAEVMFFLRKLPDAMLSSFDIPLWKRLLAGVLYGGITEEILMRMFLMSLVAWVLGKASKGPEGKPSSGAFVLAIVVVAILFGLGHLPATSAMAPLTQSLVARALVLNGIAGVAFGWLYWKRGLEAAMAGHMGTHLVLQIPGVMLIKTML